MKSRLFFAVFLVFLLLFLVGCEGFDDYELVIGIVGEGQVSLSPDRDYYLDGTEVRLTAVPGSGYYFKEWQGDVTGSQNPAFVTMDDDKQVTAVFTEQVEIGTLTIHERDLSSGSASLTLENYRTTDEAFVILFPMDDAGASHVVERLSTSQEGATPKPPHILSPLHRSLGEKFPLPDIPSLRAKEKELLRIHPWASNIPSRAHIASDPPLGAEEDFLVFLEGDHQDTVTGVLKRKGDNYLLWVDKNQNISAIMLTTIGDFYESITQPTVTQYFGREPQKETFEVLETSGERVNILLAPLEDAGGYFYGADLYSRDIFEVSNERKIIYIRYFQEEAEKEANFRYLQGTIAHELQHMLFFNEQVLAGRPFDIDDIWINEGFSQLAEDLVGHGYAQGVGVTSVNQFAANPSAVSLIDWQGDYPDYGITYLFARYLFDRFGSDILAPIYTSDQEPRVPMTNTTKLDFKTLFRDFAITLLLHRYAGIEDRFSFHSIDLEVQRTELAPGSSWNNKNIKGWGIHYTEIGPGNGNDLTIEIKGAALLGKIRMFVVERRGE